MINPKIQDVLRSARRALENKTLQLFAPNPGVACMYEIKVGDKTYHCAVGAWMADNGAYNPNYEGQSVRAIMGRFEPNGKFYSETTAISQLQRAHDNKISDIYNAYRS